MIYEAEVRQTTVGRIFIKANSQKEAEEVAGQYVQDEQNFNSVDFDEIWDYDICSVSEADTVGDVDIIKADDVL